MKHILLSIALSTISISTLASECRVHTNGEGQICGLAKADNSVFIGKNSKVSGNILITGNVKIKNSELIGTSIKQQASGIWGNTQITNSTLSGFYKISGNVIISGKATKKSIILNSNDGKITLYNDVKISGESIILKGNHTINGNVQIQDGTTIDGNTKMWGQVEVSKAKLSGTVTISGKSKINGSCEADKECININANSTGISIYGNAQILDEVTLSDQVTFAGRAKASGKAQFKDRVQIYAGTFEDKVQFSENSRVWGNATHLKGDTRVSGRYSVFNINANTGWFHSDKYKFSKDMFSPLSDKLLEDFSQSVAKGESQSNAVNVRYSLNGKRPNAITQDEATGLLNHLVDLFSTRLENTNDGCFLRAHVASLEADKKGIQTSKVVILTPHAINKPGFEKITENSRLLRFNNGIKDHKWVSHYSNLVFIKDSQGREVPHILDPAMSMKPMTLKQWTKMVTKETMPNDKNAILSFIVMPKQINTFASYLRNADFYEPIYNREANTKNLLKLLDEIGYESSIMAENYN